jgi:hypothetical protein
MLMCSFSTFNDCEVINSYPKMDFHTPPDLDIRHLSGKRPLFSAGCPQIKE